MQLMFCDLANGRFITSILGDLTAAIGRERAVSEPLSTQTSHQRTTAHRRPKSAHVHAKPALLELGSHALEAARNDIWNEEDWT
jgi:hypothetical protein